MAKGVGKSGSRKLATSKKIDPLFGISKSSFLHGAKHSRSTKLLRKKNVAHVFFLGDSQARSSCLEDLSPVCQKWQLNMVKKASGSVLVQSEVGPIWVVGAGMEQKPKSGASHYGLLEESAYGNARERMGSIFSAFKPFDIDLIKFIFVGALDEQVVGALVGLEMASYRYRTVRAKKAQITAETHDGVNLEVAGCSARLIGEAAAIGRSTNIARHLVNIPAGDLHPKSYAEFIKKLFTGSKTTKVVIWDSDRIQKEGLLLLHSVGKAAEFDSRLVHIRYRPTGKRRISAPIAFVGKGVTFDTGGLDVKPAQFMRLMKKDMGGSASMAGLAWWMSETNHDVAADFYLALSENAVDERAMRPGDVLTAANGRTVEIHNTDAEGRLVLADALLVAINQKGKDKPAAVIDAATLTGAMRVALGTKFAGLCSNDDKLADAILHAAQASGDPCWRLPLVPEYGEMLVSSVADMTNCASGSYGGAITAALFLERFVGATKWAHLDMMAWADKTGGSISEVGGNGQMVQGLINFLENLSSADLA